MPLKRFNKDTLIIEINLIGQSKYKKESLNFFVDISAEITWKGCFVVA